jgi:regulator of PEP synthase PpsR (kinase-PPPase family)
VSVGASLPSGATHAARRTVFFLSDRTGITAEMFGNSLLTQFEGVPVPSRDDSVRRFAGADR